MAGESRSAAQIARFRSAHQGARSSRLRIFPVGFRGSSARKSMLRGHLSFASRPPQGAMSSSSSTVDAGMSSTTALISSPRSSCGVPKTGRVGNRGVGAQNLLDLGRVDVRAANQDHVVDAAHDVEEALLVLVGHARR